MKKTATTAMKKTSTLLCAALLTTAAASAQQSIHYIALELDDASRQRVVEYAEAHLPWADANVIAHHMTILHRSGLRCQPDDPEVAAKDYVLAWALEHEGEEFCFTASEVGHSDRAFALRVTDVPVPSRNRIKHITLATNRATGGSAVDSNNIYTWTPLDDAMSLKGRLTIYYMTPATKEQ